MRGRRTPQCGATSQPRSLLLQDDGDWGDDDDEGKEETSDGDDGAGGCRLAARLRAEHTQQCRARGSSLPTAVARHWPPVRASRARLGSAWQQQPSSSMSPLRGCFSSRVQLRPPLIPRPSLFGLLLLELLVLLLEEEEQLSGRPGTHTSPSSPSSLSAEEHNEGGEGGPVNDQPVCAASAEPVGTRDGAEDPDR